MRQVSLREFRIRGAKALAAVPVGETILLAGQKGPAYFLVPVIGDVAVEARELRRARAKASLRQYQKFARATGLDQLSDEDIEREIHLARRQLRRGKR